MRLAVLVALAACHGGGADTGTPGDTAPPDPTLDPQPPPPLNAHSGTILPNPHVVTITWPGYRWQADVEAFGGVAVQSDWLTTVAAEYGIGPGTAEAVRLTEKPPRSLTDEQVRAFLTGLLGNELPQPDEFSTIYLLYVPSSVVQTFDGGTLCVNGGYGGYHNFQLDNGHRFAYAVIGDCTGRLDSVTVTASHEIVEAATDPYQSASAGYYVDPTLPDPWFGAWGWEVADLCEDGSEFAEEGGFAFQRSWSSAAAARGATPCVPVPAGNVDIDVTADPNLVQKVPAGGSTTFTLTGWASAAHAPWSLYATSAEYTQFDAAPVLDAGSMSAGKVAHVTLTAPAGARHGHIGLVFVHSGYDGTVRPVGIEIE